MNDIRLPAVSLLALVFAAASPVLAQDQGPARGTAFWIVMPSSSVGELTSSVLAVPRFAIGIRRGRTQLGLALGVTRLSALDRDEFGPGQSTEDEITATTYQVGPALIQDLWTSADARTRSNFSAGVTIGRVSMTDRTETRDPQFPTTVVETKTRGTLFGFHAAFGGDHFLSPHFALGAEAGLQGTFGKNIEDKATPGERLGIGAAGTYAAVRVTFVF